MSDSNGCLHFDSVLYLIDSRVLQILLNQQYVIIKRIINLLYNKNHNNIWFHFFIYSGFWFSSVFCNLSVRSEKDEIWKIMTVILKKPAKP